MLNCTGKIRLWISTELKTRFIEAPPRSMANHLGRVTLVTVPWTFDPAGRINWLPENTGSATMAVNGSPSRATEVVRPETRVRRTCVPGWTTVVDCACTAGVSHSMADNKAET